MPVGDLYALKFNYFVQGRVCSINLGYRDLNAGLVHLQAKVLADAFDNSLLALFQNVFSVDVQIQSLYVLGVNPKGNIPEMRNYLDINGLRPGTAMPNDSPVIISLTTDAPNSKHNGRIYLSGISETDVENQKVTPAFQGSQLEDLADALKTDIEDTDAPVSEFEPSVLVRQADGIPVTPPSSHGVIGWAMNGIIYSQRRRRTKRNEIGVVPP